MELPFVSAIMPTCGRPEMAARAVDMFLAQDYANAELIVVDDGYPQFSPVSNDKITYEWSSRKRSVGAKRNIACAIASGDVIIHWDDDDVYAPARISDQVGRLMSADGLEMTGYSEMLFRDPRGRTWLFEGHENYAVGVSMCYWKTTWRDRPFRDVTSGEDTEFWKGRRCLSVPAGQMIVAHIHRGNTSVKDTTEEGWRLVSS